MSGHIHGHTNRAGQMAVMMTVVLAMAAVLILEHARTIPGFESTAAMRWGAALACPAFAWIGLSLTSRAKLRRILVPILCGVTAAPTAMTWLDWVTGTNVPPLEKNLMQAIEGAIVAFCLFLGTEPQRRRVASTCGLMGIMGFASIPEMTREAVWAMTCLTLAIPLWLYLEHQAALPPRDDRRDFAWEPLSRRAKLRGLVIRLTVLGLLAGLVVWQFRGDRAIHRVLAEWVGSSGGTGETNELATAGVGDGPNEVAASENADSVGFTDSDIYLESDRPSLFDAFNEQYGEPYKPKQHQRMQAMGPQNVKETDGKPKENLDAGRTFEMQRKQAAAARKPEDRPAKALAYVKGDAGSRLKLATFDRFDGSAWLQETDCPEACPLRVEATGKGDCWFCLHLPWPDSFGESVDHKIKIAALDTSVVPAPANLAKYRVGGLREPSMFGWAGRGVVRMLDRTIPAGTTIDAQSQRVSRRHLYETAFRDVHVHTIHHHHFRQGGDYALSAEARTVVDGWNLGTGRSWLQVERLMKRLREHAVADSSEGTPEPVAETQTDAAPALETGSHRPDVLERDSVDRFLIHKQGGPDYLVATAATVILRDLGYPCRLASGLYVDPASYDASKAHYVLDSRHVHFWVELLTPQNVWVPIDPSPGYLDEFAHETWADLLAIQLWRAADWAGRNRMPLGLAIAAVLAVVALRGRIYDLAMTQYLAHGPQADPRTHVLRTVRHLEWRLARHLGRRPPQKSLRSHWAKLTQSRGELATLLNLGEWAAYAPADRSPPCPAETIDRLCLTAARDWKRNELRLWTSQGPNRS